MISPITVLTLIAYAVLSAHLSVTGEDHTQYNTLTSALTVFPEATVHVQISIYDDRRRNSLTDVSVTRLRVGDIHIDAGPRIYWSYMTLF